MANANRPHHPPRYDRYRLLNTLSQFPNFRWCLNPSVPGSPDGCGNGQLYEDGADADPHIQCGECGFEMCYSHQTPWHSGLTCAQHDSVTAHGDPSFVETAQWIRDHTKDCPGCGAHIRKGDGCFHMTCSNCRAEFCWECRADWKLIAPRAGQHNRRAHADGCWFRRGGREPTQVAGRSLNEALREGGRGN